MLDQTPVSPGPKAPAAPAGAAFPAPCKFTKFRNKKRMDKTQDGPRFLCPLNLAPAQSSAKF
eukprot:SAG31_NODE_5647_length_2404_cov_5.691540_1_plen_62_part_00